MNDKSRFGATPNRGWFRKGRSGNPGGRRTTSRPSRASAFDVVVEKTVCTENHIRIDDVMESPKLAE
jgi:hypothetical protein